ncbi:NACHT, LRR and PYD domains-containing protein 1 [Symbiodinium microadriaticum]|uniref:NACHT, LRR and PYD domains-containing protein 1 n=2 Tax=Symbiodinium TaxID=2949 RepID=A0A1Q9F1H0_SYMMI|nr:NACHT, LRR and PYD domains-containing protein 1 [Symbiodinium microadriaticum]
MSDSAICCTELELRKALEDEGCRKLVLKGATLAADAVEACIALFNFQRMGHLTELRLEDLPLQPGSLEHVAHAVSVPGQMARTSEAHGVEAEEMDLDLFGDGVEDLEASLAAIPVEEIAAEPAPCEGPGLRSLTLSYCPCSPSDAWSPLWRSLPPSLKELDLSGNALSDHAIAALSGALRGRAGLRLGLRGNRCKDIDRLCDAVSRGCVEALDLSENLLNDKSVQQLCEIVGAPGCRLLDLNLSGNSRLTSSSLATLFAKLPRSGSMLRSPIRRLTLRRTSLCDKGVLFLSGMLSELVLELLDLACCTISPPLVSDLLVAAQAAPGVRCIVVDDAGQRLRWNHCDSLESLFRTGANVDAGEAYSHYSPLLHTGWLGACGGPVSGAAADGAAARLISASRTAKMPDKKEAASLVTAAEKHLKVGNAQQSVQAATSASEIFRGLGTEGEGALPDVLRLVIDGKRMLAIQQQEDLAPVRQFAEDAKSNFAKAGNARGEAAMMISMAEITLSERTQPLSKARLPSIQLVDQVRDKGAKQGHC